MYQKLGIKRERRNTTEIKKPFQGEEKKKTSAGEEGFLTGEMKESLAPVFARFEKEILVKAYLDDSSLSREVEGFVREIISKIQSMRKEANFNVLDHITVYLTGNDRLAEILTRNREAICGDVLADEVKIGELDGFTMEWDVNGEKATFGVKVRE